MSPARTILPLHRVVDRRDVVVNPKEIVIPKEKFESSTVQSANSKLLVSVKYYKQTKNEE